MHFADDVVDSCGDGEEFRRQQRVNRNFWCSKSESKVRKNCEGKSDVRGMPANRVALYNGILRDRVAQRMTYSYWFFFCDYVNCVITDYALISLLFFFFYKYFSSLVKFVKGDRNKGKYCWWQQQSSIAAGITWSLVFYCADWIQGGSSCELWRWLCQYRIVFLATSLHVSIPKQLLFFSFFFFLSNL